MNLGSVQTVLVCAPSEDGAVVAPCPDGTRPQATQAYVIAVDSAPYLNAQAEPFDYGTAALYWSTAFVTLIWLYTIPWAIGAINSLIKRGM